MATLQFEVKGQLGMKRPKMYSGAVRDNLYLLCYYRQGRPYKATNLLS
jgi:hypothetical protein